MNYKMFLPRLLYFLLAFISKGKEATYHKYINHKNKKRCVDANTTKKVAIAFNANLGSCLQQNCTIYKGTYSLPCCQVNAYECYNDVINDSK